MPKRKSTGQRARSLKSPPPPPRREKIREPGWRITQADDLIHAVAEHLQNDLDRPMQYVGRLIEGSSDHRKGYPIAEGLLDYFPDALAEVSNVSWVGNQKHNPGEPMHHARGKSMDHANCIARHLMERGGYDTIVVDGRELRIRHSAALAWRALALLQEELEAELGLSLPRGARG